MNAFEKESLKWYWQITSLFHRVSSKQMKDS